MKHLILLVTICLSSCATKQSFKIAMLSDTTGAFEAVYRPYNVQGGDAIWGFAHAARDFAVDSVIAEGPKRDRHAEKITLTDADWDYSLSGYYSFTITGEAVYAKTPPERLTIYDDTTLIRKARSKARRNQITKTIVSPVITAIDSAIYGGANMPVSKHTYIMRNGE